MNRTFSNPEPIPSGLGAGSSARVGATVRSNYRVGRRWNARAGVTSERDEFSAFDEGVLIPELGREFINPSRLLFADLGVSFDLTRGRKSSS